MRKLFSVLFLTASLFYLTGCIAGGGEPYDDSESVYEPTIVVEETIVDDENYTLTLNEIIRKSHKDVGNITEITFQYHNKTDKKLFLTSDVIRFDGQDVDISILAFFEELSPNSEGTVTAYFQDIKEKDWTFTPPKSSVYMELNLVEEKSSEIIETYEVEVDF